MKQVLVTWPDYPMDDPRAGARLAPAGIVPVLAPKRGPRTETEIAQLARGCFAVIASTDPFTEAVLTQLPDLRLIARVGVGMDSIDIDAATRLGVLVCVARGTNELAVAEHTVALMLAALRRIVQCDRSVRAGEWNRTGRLTGNDLHGKTVGLLGFGVIGRAVANLLRSFDVRLIAFDPAVASDPAVEIVAFDEVLARADILSVHVPLLPTSRHLIGARELALMKRGAILVNTSRGGIIDEASLKAALADGHIGMSALDVFEEEPPSTSFLLAATDRTILTPHVAGLTVESIAAMQEHATDAVIDVLKGRMPQGVVDPSAWRDGAPRQDESAPVPQHRGGRP
ncbi:MAG TPA: phosphoglycerate dehydrogenase [Candidatus Limnocylindria bacterium]|nr:phosphoglycerate dehydrogenase [Candidatus Limnocylindria bacterium]